MNHLERGGEIMKRKIGDLKKGNLFIIPEGFSDLSGDIAIVHESHLMMNEIPFVIIFGEHAGDTGYFMNDSVIAPQFDIEVELFDPRYEIDLEDMISHMESHTTDVFSNERIDDLQELEIQGGCACPLVAKQNGTENLFNPNDI